MGTPYSRHLTVSYFLQELIWREQLFRYHEKLDTVSIHHMHSKSEEKVKGGLRKQTLPKAGGHPINDSAVFYIQVKI
ncbi:MAG: hypothetical protein RR614_10510, partial [Eubacterium sp.]